MSPVGPIRVKLTEGQAHDGRSAADMYGSIGAGQTLLANRAYVSDALRDTLTACGAVANIRPMPTQRRFPAFDAVLYSRRNRVERFFSKIKHFRAVATRHDKRDDTFLASIQLDALRIWLRTYEPVT